MAKIVYGVSGEGSGHSSRAREIAGHLVGRGHEVKLVSYDRGYKNLCNDFDVSETEGLHIVSEDNKVSVAKTFLVNLKKASKGRGKYRELSAKLFDEFQPDVVLTDFEPMTAYLARYYKRPLITIDNQHRIRYMKFPCPMKLQKDRKVTKTVIQAMIPRPDASLVTTFYFGEVKNDRTFLFPPILRKQVLEISPARGAHVLVYHTGPYPSFLETLKRFPHERFLVYGYNRNAEDENLQFKEFSSEGFLADLASCKAVMATAGFTLMTEALFLKKPVLAKPMKGQFEQELNGLLLDLTGYGLNMRKVDEDGIAEFLKRIPDYENKLKTYYSEGSHAIKAKLDEILAENCALAKEYRRLRKAA